MTCAILFLTLLAMQAPAEHADDAHSPIDPVVLERPQELIDGIGKVHQEITTGPAGDEASVAAQRYYDQGLAYLHNFVWIEAARAFHEALRRAPKCALAWVGLSRAESGLTRKSEARRALDQAQACASEASPRERRFVQLRAQQLDAMDANGDAQKELHAAYKKALEQAIADFPDEVEFRMLRGNAEEPSPGGIGQVAETASIAWYESVLTRVPDHFGAFHCLAHAYENFGDHATALARADRYRDLAPRIPHAWHMCGHDLPRLGRWTDAEKMFEHAEELADAYEKREQLRHGDDWHRAHNLLLLAYTQLNSGDGDGAIASFRRHYETPIRNARMEYAHACCVEALLLTRRVGDATPLSMELQSYERPALTRAVGAALEGEIRLSESDDVAFAQTKLEQCDAALAEDDAQSKTNGAPATGGSLYRGARVYRTLLAALIDLRGERRERGAQSLLAFADDVANNPRFDAWGEGLFRIERAWLAARKLGLAELASQLTERMKKIDPRFDPAAFASTSSKR